MTNTLQKTLETMGYRAVVPCRRCKHCDVEEVACGSQSFMTIHTCRKAREQVSPDCTCDHARRKA